PGAAEKVKAAQDLLRRYERAHGKAAHDAARSALDRDAAHHGAVLDFLAYASDPNKHYGGGPSRGERRYGPRAAGARIIQVIEAWLGSRWRPAFAFSRQEDANG